MKFFFTPVFLFYVLISYSQNSGYCGKFNTTLTVFNENSFTPAQGKDFNEELFRDNMLGFLDPDAVLFGSDDLKILEAAGESVKINPEGSYCREREAIINLYTDNLQRSLFVLDELKSTALDFNIQDSVFRGLEFNKEIYSRNKQERWISLIKYYVLQGLAETAAGLDSLRKLPGAFEENIEEVKQKVIEREEKRLKKVLHAGSGTEEYVYHAFINSLLVQFDPYSYLFSEKLYHEFREQLSTYTNSYGIRLEIDKSGELVVSSIVPGSYAWRTGRINSGDKIIKIQSENAEPLVLKGFYADELVEYLSETGADKVTLTLSGNFEGTKEVVLFRENIQNDENSVQALILNGEKKVGYILLPAFYTSWDLNDSKGCARDVGKAIYELKKENIESLIIDLRNNGGGSIMEAIDLAGIFIDFGTLSIGQKVNKELYSIKDFNRGKMYSGPLAILMNNNSASASEMVAAVLQDYNRAIIVGDTSYGKATGQILVPVHQNNKDVLKVTATKYFRVTGNSYGQKGVVPHITIPGIKYKKYQPDREESTGNESVDKKTYFKPLEPFPLEELKQKSDKRIKKSIEFRKISKVDSVWANSGMYRNYVSVNFDNYLTRFKLRENVFDEVHTMKNKGPGSYTVDFLKSDAEMLEVYKYYSDLFFQLSESVKRDPYIKEVCNILVDYIKIKSNED